MFIYVGNGDEVFDMQEIFMVTDLGKFPHVADIHDAALEAAPDVLYCLKSRAPSCFPEGYDGFSYQYLRTFLSWLNMQNYKRTGDTSFDSGNYKIDDDLFSGCSECNDNTANMFSLKDFVASNLTSNYKFKFSYYMSRLVVHCVNFSSSDSILSIHDRPFYSSPPAQL